jgi:alpha-ribazole phosphatase
MQVYLVRHPEPVGCGGLCYGRTDLEVAPASVAAAVDSIRAQIPERVLAAAAVVTSPLLRCLALARALAAPHEPQVAADLVEMDFGTWEGRPWDAIARAELDAWARDLWEHRPGGGESAAMIAERWRRWCEAARSEYARSGASSIIAITHGGLIRVALARAGRLSAGEFAGGGIAFGSVHRLDLDERAAPARAAS